MLTETEIRARLAWLTKLFAEADPLNSETLAVQITELEIVLGDRDPEFSA